MHVMGLLPYKTYSLWINEPFVMNLVLDFTLTRNQNRYLIKLVHLKASV